MTALERRRIGRTPIEVTTLGFGGAPLGAVGDRISDELAASIIGSAFEGGIGYFDTAPLYGHGLSEKRMGQLLGTIAREAFVLSSKVGRLLVPREEGERFAGMRDDEPVAVRYDYSYDGVRRSLDSSLQRLGLDRIDILLCHDIDGWTHGDAQPEIVAEALTGALPAMQKLRDEGVIGAIGLGVNEWQVCSRVMDEIDVDCFLLAGRFTLLEQDPLDEMLPKCADRGVSVIIGGPYNSGLLASAERRRATYNYQPVDDELWNKAQAIRGICEDHGIDMRAAALQYPLRHPAVAAVIPGMWSQAEVATNLEFISAELPGALWADLANAGLSRGW
ncbi:MAG: aldo/keto reductase [Pseudomonadales bacterium]